MLLSLQGNIAEWCLSDRTYGMTHSEADRYNDRYPKSVLTMNVILAIPEELQIYIDAQIQTGAYASAVEYFLDLVQQDRQRKQAQAKLEGLLQEGLDSDGEVVTAAYWQNLRASVFDGNS